MSPKTIWRRCRAQLKNGRQLEVDAYDRANEKQIEAGKLTSLDNQVDTATGTVKFRAEFPNRNLSLFPNQFVNARLLVRTLTGVTPGSFGRPATEWRQRVRLHR